MKKRDGSALIEVLISCIILGMAAVTIGNILLSLLLAPKLDQDKFMMAAEAAALKEELKNYVTADISITDNAPGNPPWHMPEDTSCAACWALSPGTHDVSARLPAGLRAQYNVTLRYTVEIADCGGRTCQNVKIHTDWEVPN